MEQPVQYNSPDQFSEEKDSSSFDYRTWIIRILKGWYFFVISLIVCMGIAYLQNRSWKPIYKTNALVIIEDSKGYMGSQAMLLQGFGAEKAYALDGGQTAVIVTNDQLINRPSYGYQRMISDIIYFATAIPDGG